MKYDTWNQWTTKSSHIPFKSDKKTIGNGEKKLAFELNTNIEGQNQSFDMMFNNEEFECKFLDSQNSFRLGVRINPLCTDITRRLLNICDRVKIIVNKTNTIKNSPLLRSVRGIYKSMFEIIGRNKYSIYEGLQKQELCGSSLKILSGLIEELKNMCLKQTRKIQLYNPITMVPTILNIGDAYNVLQIFENENNIKEFFYDEDEYIHSMISYYIYKHIQNFTVTSVSDMLDCMVRGYFAKTRLIVVHESKGYIPIDNLSCIRCSRITSGNPRGIIQL